MPNKWLDEITKEGIHNFWSSPNALRVIISLKRSSYYSYMYYLLAHFVHRGYLWASYDFHNKMLLFI
jgi:acyl-coenzyme A synthetase/AMP-(fatty) acid ligase